MIFYVLNSAENDSECQNPKNPIFIRFGYYLCRNDIQWKIDANMIFYVLNSAENDSECQNPKNPIFIRFGYCLCRNYIQ